MEVLLMFKVTLNRKNKEDRKEDREKAANLGGILTKSIFISSSGYFSETYQFIDKENFDKFKKRSFMPEWRKVKKDLQNLKDVV